MDTQLAFSAPLSLFPNAAQTTPFDSSSRCTHRPQTALSVSQPSTPSKKSVRNRRTDESRKNAPRGKRVPTYRKMQNRHRQGPAFHRREQQDRKLSEIADGAQSETQSQIQENPNKTDEQPPLPKRPFSDIRLGERLFGVVRNTVPHGAYVDVGAEKDGLVHVRDMAVDFVHTPTDIVRSGDTVTVWVKFVNASKRVLGLTMVKPHLGFESRIKMKDIVEGGRYQGVIERITNYGAYVDIGAERQAFLHVAALWGALPRETLDFLRLGQKIWVHVAEVDTQRNHIRLWARGKDDLPLTYTTEILTIPVHSEQRVEDAPVPTPTLRAWDVNKTGDSDVNQVEEGSEEDDSVQHEYEEDEFSFAEDDSEWLDESITGKRKPHQTDNLREVAHMFDEATEFIDDNVRTR
ncbi:hypothetical protein BWQ96_03801 [Gracilariopsis chorda]|uniref:S1 motif domain-containing protein n=1 Tax=Gracilariopsis chorda TaxID=448386 RepID=A0A2V3IXI7_9FLOR|nr:hypothetical protein BWQ96_03801 [Gracilariopsis chorda]|eukprot:PXF46407.1 hypothetical protein BWQ96_03801 [Gracilariopsis chorda]